jgi:small subunit ribosomal protein S3
MTVERFFIEEAKKGYHIESFLRRELESAGFSHAEVKKTPLGMRIIIYAMRPGLVIGSGGSNIRELTAYVSSQFGLENPHLEVEQVEEAYLDPHIVAWKIARSMERGTYFKRIANIMLNNVVRAGAKGVEIRLSGKLPGSRARTWKFVEGKLRKCGQEAIDQVKVAYAEAMTRPGIAGVKVSILPPDADFSDQIKKKYSEKDLKAVPEGEGDSPEPVKGEAEPGKEEAKAGPEPGKAEKKGGPGPKKEVKPKEEVAAASRPKKGAKEKAEPKAKPRKGKKPKAKSEAKPKPKKQEKPEAEAKVKPEAKPEAKAKPAEKGAGKKKPKKGASK